MGLFKKEEKTKLELYLDEIRKNKISLEVENYLREVIKGEISNPFITDENLIEILVSYIASYNDGTLEEYIEDLKELFDQIYISHSQFNNFNYLIKAHENDMIKIFDINLFNLFENEKNFYTLMLYLIECDNILSLNDEKKIVSFMIDARSYFATEEQYVASMYTFVNKITYGINIEDLIKRSIEDLRKKEGIYDISEDTLEEIHSKVMGADGFLKNLEDAVQKAEKLKTSLNEKVDNYRTDISVINQEGIERYKKELEKDLSELQETITKAKDELDKYILTKMNETSLELSKKTVQALADLGEEKAKIIASLKGFEGTLASIALSKSAELSKVGSEQLTKLTEFVKNNSNLKEVIESMGVSSETLAVVQDLINHRDEINAAAAQGSASGLLLPSPAVIVPQEITVDYTINPYFDKTRSFESRISEIKEKMERNREEKGILYHSETLNVITAILEELSPYLYGPSGGGKSMAVALIADLLGMPYINVGYINEEYQVIGAEPFLGNFKRSGIHECYQEGKIAFVDEFDNGNQRATIALNPFLRHSEDYYTFANMERVKRHPNFRMIAAGNTDGRGGTRNHSTREAIEGSVLQRLTPFFIGYDENVESELLKSHPEWYEFIKIFRLAQASWSGNEGELTLEDAVTTSDVATINRMLEDQAFTPEQIMAIEFVQAKSEEYLRAIQNYLNNNYSPSSRKESTLLKAYKEEVKKYSLKRGFRHE